MRILMTVSSTSLMDGINRHVLAIAGGLNKLPGVVVGVVTVHSWGDFNDALKAAGVPCWALGCANGHQFRVVSRFCRVMREFKPDIIHVHVLAFFEAVVLKWLYPSVKLVATAHGICDPVVHVPMRVRIMKALGISWFCNFLTNRPVDAWVYISRGIRAASHGISAPVIYNPMRFDSAYCRPSRSQSSLLDPQSSFVIGTACRVEDVKNPLAFTRVLGEVTKRLENVEAWIVGDGSALDACRQLAVERGYDKIKFWGRRNDAKELIAQMDCFVLTSRREGMPGALLEAMSVKTPIAFMKGDGGLQDLAEMNEKEGAFSVVVDQGDEAGMVSGICAFLKDPVRVEANALLAFEVGRRHFDVDIVLRQLYEVYLGCERAASSPNMQV